MATGWAKVAVHAAEGDAHARWYLGVLAHAGIHVEELDSSAVADVHGFDVLLLCGRGTLTQKRIDTLSMWVQAGGCLVVSGGTWGLDELIGCHPGRTRHLSSGYAEPSGSDRLWPGDVLRAKFFGAVGVQPTCAQPVIQANGYTVVSRHGVGAGSVIFVGMHLGQTYAQMAMGHAVDVDGIGAEDGSANLDDGILRAEDGHNLSFEHDRMQVDGSTVPFFAAAYVDILCEVYLRAVFEAVDATKKATVLLWPWPDFRPGVATLTLDVQEFEVDRVIALQRVLQMFGCPGTWLVSTPGYSADVYRALRAMDQEVGLLFHVDDSKGWQEERLRIQLSNLCRLASSPHIGSVRPEGGQWRGYDQFYDSLEASGAKVSLSKMGRLPGTSGFLFGTCHPFFPSRQDGKESSVLEVPGLIWLPGACTPEAVGASLADLVRQRAGCLHIAMRPESISDPAVAMALRRVLTACKEHRFAFLRPEEISRFERGRRNVRMSLRHLGGAATVQLASDIELQGLSVLVSGPPRQAADKSHRLHSAVVEHYGTTFSMATVDVSVRTPAEIEWTPLSDEGARAA